MRSIRILDLGTSVARCVRCRQISALTLRETRYARRWTELLSTGFDAAPARSASCAGCGQTYPVRSTDVSVVPAARRDESVSGGAWQYPVEQLTRPRLG